MPTPSLDALIDKNHPVCTVDIDPYCRNLRVAKISSHHPGGASEGLGV